MPNSRYEMTRKAMQSQAVRDKLAEVAKRGAARAQAHAQGRDRLRGATVTVTTGTRPQGRPFARITVTGGASEMDRRQVLAAATVQR